MSLIQFISRFHWTMIAIRFRHFLSHVLHILSQTLVSLTEGGVHVDQFSIEGDPCWLIVLLKGNGITGMVTLAT